MGRAVEDAVLNGAGIGAPAKALFHKITHFCGGIAFKCLFNVVLEFFKKSHAIGILVSTVPDIIFEPQRFAGHKAAVIGDNDDA